MEALAMHTSWAAQSLGLADRVGSLSTGLEANVVVLDRDPRYADLSDLEDIAPSAVIQQGAVVHGALTDGGRARS